MMKNPPAFAPRRALRRSFAGARLVGGLVLLPMLLAVAQAAPPVCPTPTQGYEITGCFADGNGDEYPTGGTVDVYDLAFGESLSDTFPMGTFLVDAFLVTPPSSPPASCGACGPIDYCVVVNFNPSPDGTPDEQTFCADGDATVSGGGFDLTSLNGGAPIEATISGGGGDDDDDDDDDDIPVELTEFEIDPRL